MTVDRALLSTLLFTAFVAFTASPGQAQSCLIETIAGGGRSFSGDGGPALEAEFDGLTDAVAAADGTIFAADSRNGRIRRITPDGIVTTLAGPQDGLVEPTRLVIAPAGAVLAYDGGARRIWRISAAGAVEQLLDLRLTRTAHLGKDLGLAVGVDGAVYIAAPETNRVWRLDAEGELAPFAGTGEPGDAENNGDGGPAVMATLNEPRDVDVGPDGALYIAEAGAFRVRKVAPDGVIATAVSLPPQSGDVFATGLLGWLESFRFLQIRPLRVSAGEGFIDVLLEDGLNGSLGIGIPGLVPPTAAPAPSQGTTYLDFSSGSTAIHRFFDSGERHVFAGLAGEMPQSVDLLPDGRYLFVDDEDQLYADSPIPRVYFDVDIGIEPTPRAGLERIAGLGRGGAAGDGGPADQARLFAPRGVVGRRSGEIFVADDTRVRWIDRSGVIRSLPGDLPSARLAVDPKDNVYIATDEEIFRMRSSGLMEQVAQLELCERGQDCGDSGPVRDAKFFGFSDMAAGSDGTLYVLDKAAVYSSIGLTPFPVALTPEKEQIVVNPSDFDPLWPYTSGQRLRTISPHGEVGTAVPEEQFLSNNPTIGPDASGGILLSSSAQSNLLRVSGTTRTVVAGSPGFVESIWSGGPSAVAGGANQEVYFSRDNTVRRISVDGHINTIAGRVGRPGRSGNGGRAEDALLDQPASLALTGDGDLLIADASAGTVRIIRDPAGCDSTLRPQIRLDGIVRNGSGSVTGNDFASFLLGYALPPSNGSPILAPGSLITVRGVRLGPAPPAEVDLAAADRLPFELGGVTVEINGLPAPLLVAGGSRIEAVVPTEAPTEGTAYLRVIIDDVASDEVPLAMQPTAPSVLAVFNGDGSTNEAMAPASAGGEIIVLVSGLGLDADATAVAQIQRTMPAEGVSARLYRDGQTHALEILSVSTWPDFPESVAAVRIRLPNALEADTFSGFIHVDGASARFYVRVASLQ